MENNYYTKYLKYKSKYMELQKEYNKFYGGGPKDEENYKKIKNLFLLYSKDREKQKSDAQKKYIKLRTPLKDKTYKYDEETAYNMVAENFTDEQIKKYDEYLEKYNNNTLNSPKTDIDKKIYAFNIAKLKPDQEKIYNENEQIFGYKIAYNFAEYNFLDSHIGDFNKYKNLYKDIPRITENDILNTINRNKSNGTYKILQALQDLYIEATKPTLQDMMRERKQQKLAKQTQTQIEINDVSRT